MLRRPVLTSLLAVLLAGCAIPGMGVPGSSANQPVDPLAGIAFKPITADNARYFQNTSVGASSSSAMVPTGAPGPAPNAQASASPLASSSSGGAYSGDTNGTYYNFPFSVPGGSSGGQAPMALVSMTQAETKGAQATFQAAIKIAAPVVAAWGSDGRLIQSSATVGNDGTPVPDGSSGGGSGYGYSSPPYPVPMPMMTPTMTVSSSKMALLSISSGWRLTYYSTGRNELLNFFVAADKTVIIRLKWAPLDLAPSTVTVDSNAAIQDLTNAIQTKGFQSVEEKTGLDYFLGTAFNTANNASPGVPYGPYGPYGQLTTLYEVPANAQWNISLQSILGKLVWQMNFYGNNQPNIIPPGAPVPAGTVSTGSALAPITTAPTAAPPVLASNAPNPPSPTPWVTPTPSTGPGIPSYINYSGSGLIDAQTGAVIRFSRPTRFDYTNQPQPIIEPPGYYSPPPSPKPSP
jgi:hypothetical protein